MICSPLVQNAVVYLALVLFLKLGIFRNTSTISYVNTLHAKIVFHYCVKSLMHCSKLLVGFRKGCTPSTDIWIGLNVSE